MMLWDLYVRAQLDRDEDIVSNNERTLYKIRGSVEFKDLWFAYNDNNYVLKNINFKIKEGESIAFVGST